MLSVIVVSALTASATDLASAPLAGVADAVRDRMKARTLRLLDRAKQKAGDRPLDPSDRVSAKVLGEALWVDDSVTVDYLAGVLTASSQEDDAAAVVALIGRLSAAQLRMHFVIYRELRRLALGSATNLYVTAEARFRRYQDPGRGPGRRLSWSLTSWIS